MEAGGLGVRGLLIRHFCTIRLICGCIAGEAVLTMACQVQQRFGLALQGNVQSSATAIVDRVSAPDNQEDLGAVQKEEQNKQIVQGTCEGSCAYAVCPAPCGG